MFNILVQILVILGSLGIFLYGMKVLSEAIQKVAGQRMRRVMASMTSNRLSGVGTGFMTTCLLQSSSATTVIVVSFVNAGLLTLVESIGVVMGANLGTTLTAWIIALIGKFSLAKIALPIIGIGLPLFFAGKHQLKNWGEVMIGFGLLFFGLGELKDAVPDVKELMKSTDPLIQSRTGAVRGWIQTISWENIGYFAIPIFLFLGIILTLIVQSSSAAMAITVTLAINGWIGFHESCAIVLGENIGTTVTAWFASLGANANARRAARAHFLFNVIGVIWMLLAFVAFIPMVQWLGDALPDSLRNSEKLTSDYGFKLAIFHSLFNFLNICALIAFVPMIARTVTRWVKDPEPAAAGEGPRLQYISQSMLNLGQLNLPEAEKATRELAALSKEMFEGFINVFEHPKDDLSEEVARLKHMEDESDILTHDITEYLVRCSAAEIGAHNASSVASMLRVVSELEEVCDSVYRLILFTQRKYKKKREFTDETALEVRQFAGRVSAFIDLYHKKLFTRVSDADLQVAQTLEDEIDGLRKTLNKSAMRRMVEDGKIKTEMIGVDLNNHLEKIGNHALNVMQSAYYMANQHEPPEKYGVDIS
ncbi:MAG: phosphate:Na+ symporter [Verrucomicrobiales bacterium]|jgi:phosphate:Na+ symporter